VRLAGKTAIVTGGGSGFGAGIARKFVAEGAWVLIADRDPAAGERVAASLGKMAHSIAVDVTVDGDVAAMVETALLDFGGLDILVNNAGIGHTPQPMEALGEDIFDRITDINMKAIYLAARHVVPRFKERKAGVILNMASTAGVSPRPNLTWYNASKGWVITATRSMAVEFAPQRVRVNAIAPSATMTERVRKLVAGNAALGKLADSHLLGLIEPQDIANMALFLASDESRMVTGQIYPVDSGVTIS